MQQQQKIKMCFTRGVWHTEVPTLRHKKLKNKAQER